MLFSKKEREILFLLTFQNEFNSGEVDDDLDFAFNSMYETFNEILNYKIETKDFLKIQKHFNNLTSELDNIDKVISKKLKNWTIDRIGKVELALLRIYIYEVSNTEVKKQVINHIVDLAKKYGEDNSYKFINGFIRSLEEDE